MDKSTINCPQYRSGRVVKRGKRSIKYGSNQLYICKKCKKIFSGSPLPNYTYPPQAIIAAPIYYYRGYSLGQIRERMNGTFHI